MNCRPLVVGYNNHMAFLSFFKKHKPISVVIDIGSSSVGSAVVSLENNQGPHIIFCDRQPFHIGENVTAKRLILNLRQALGKTLQVTEQFITKKHSGFSIQGIMCTYCSPWHNSSTKTVRIKEETPTLITHSLIEGLLKKEERRLMNELENKKDAAIQFKEPVLLDQKIIQIKLNGYNTSEPYEKEATEIELTFFTTIASGALIDLVEDIVKKNLHSRHVNHHAFSLVAWDFISDVYSYVKNFIHLDVTGEVTDITVVEDNNIKEIASLPNGRHLLVRTIARRLDVNEEIALSYLELLARHTAHQKLEEQLKNILVDVKNEFKIVLEDTFKHMSIGSELPLNAFITADEDVADIFSESLKQIRPDIKVIILHNKNIPAHCTFTNTQYADNFVAIESAFLHKMSLLPTTHHS